MRSVRGVSEYQYSILLLVMPLMTIDGEFIAAQANVLLVGILQLWEQDALLGKSRNSSAAALPPFSHIWRIVEALLRTLKPMHRSGIALYLP